MFDGLGLRLNGNYIRNLAYSKGKIWSRSQGHLVNNFNENGEVQSGPNAWMLQATLGRSFDLKEKGDWLAFVGYKYIQPDALPDGFNDSSFHQGGTNARGYYIGGSYAFDKNVYGVLRWMSTKESTARRWPSTPCSSRSTPGSEAMDMHTVWDESGRSAPLSAGRGCRLAAMAALCAAGLTLGGAAQAESMEEKLRAQRSTTQQLQQMQSEQAQVNAAKAAAEAQRDAAQKELEALRGQLARAQARPRSCRSSRAPCWKAPSRRSPPATPSWASSRAPTTSCWSWRAPAKASALLAGALAQRDEQVKSCVAKNREMYQAGKDILNAYERVSTGDMMAMRQPFARSARVKFEEQAQEYGDKLYDAQIPASAAMQAQTK